MLRFSEGEKTPLEYSAAMPAPRQLHRLSRRPPPARQGRSISQYQGKAPICASSIQKKPGSTSSSDAQKRTTTVAGATVRAVSRANDPAGEVPFVLSDDLSEFIRPTFWLTRSRRQTNGRAARAWCRNSPSTRGNPFAHRVLCHGARLRF